MVEVIAQTQWRGDNFQECVEVISPGVQEVVLLSVDKKCIVWVCPNAPNFRIFTIGDTVKKQKGRGRTK